MEMRQMRYLLLATMFVGGLGLSSGWAGDAYPSSIERFMTTDINNPAGSAAAKSEIAIMWDYT